MQLTWVHVDPVDESRGEPLGDSMDLRYRVLPPVVGLRAQGHDAGFFSLRSETVPFPGVNDLSDRVFIFSRLPHLSPEQNREVAQRSLKVADSVQARGARLVVDLSDDRLAEAPWCDHYRALCQQSDAVVVASPALTGIAGELGQCAPKVIPDAVDGPRCAPFFEPPVALTVLQQAVTRQKGRVHYGGYSRRLRVAWFGGPDAIPELLAAVPVWTECAKQIPIKLAVVTEVNDEVMELASPTRVSDKEIFVVRVLPLSRENIWRAVDHADIVLLPGCGDALRREGQGAGRLLEAFWRGRWVVAQAAPAWESLGAWAWLGEDPCAALKWALTHRQETIERITAAQEHIARHHTPEVIAGQWQCVLTQVCENTTV